MGSGDEGMQFYSTWTSSDGKKGDFNIYYRKFEEYCKPKSNTILLHVSAKDPTSHTRKL